VGGHMTREEQVWVSGLAGTQTILLTGFVDLWHDVRLDQSETFGFTIPAADPKASFVVADGELRWRDRQFIVRRLQHVRSGAETLVEVECDAIWYRLGEKVRVGSVNIIDTTIAAGLDLLLDGSGWTRDAGTTSTSSTQYAMELQDESVLSAVRRWARVTSTFVTFNHAERTVGLSTSRGRTAGLAFRYGRNVTSVRREITPPYATRLYPYGADGLNIAGVNSGAPYLDDFTWYTSQGLSLATAQARYTKSRVWSDPTFTEDTTLKVAAQAKLARWAQPTISYECSVADLTELTGVVEDPECGDTVRVADEVLDFDIATTIVRYRRYPLQPWRNQVELAYLPDTTLDDSDLSRSQSSREWVMFKSDNAKPLTLRSDGTWVTNRIGVAFREGGEAVFGFDVNFTGRGSGTLTIQFLDTDADPDAEQHQPIVVAYADGVLQHHTATWALKELSGQYDYRVRMQAVSSTSPSVTNGIDIDTADTRFWILAHGAIRQTPVVATEQRFDRNAALAPDAAAVQYFTVPDNVTEVEVEVGGAGTTSHSSSVGGNIPGSGAAGAVVTGKLNVVPGSIIDVYCASRGGHFPSLAEQKFLGGWPNGGDGSEHPSVSTLSGHGGGGSSDIRPSGGSFSQAYIVAAGAGGPSAAGTNGNGGNGGNGGYLVGAPGTNWYGSVDNFGDGATRSAGGTGGREIDGFGADAGPSGGNGASNQGGDAAFVSDSAVDGPGGGGGGGWYGGGGAGLVSALYDPCGGGGGGSSWTSGDVFDVDGSDGGNTGHGYVVFRWDDPFTDI
jgi:phage minor structural protein